MTLHPGSFQVTGSHDAQISQTRFESCRRASVTYLFDGASFHTFKTGRLLKAGQLGEAILMIDLSGALAYAKLLSSKGQ